MKLLNSFLLDKRSFFCISYHITIPQIINRYVEAITSQLKNSLTSNNNDGGYYDKTGNDNQVRSSKDEKLGPAPSPSYYLIINPALKSYLDTHVYVLGKKQSWVA